MAPNEMVTVLEHCRVTPPSGAVAETSLLLTFFDISWLNFSPIQRLIFYEFPCSKKDFMETVIPKLKDSLSLTLKHFFPLAGNLVVASSSSKPEIRYVDGDGVSLSVAESRSDFFNLSGNHSRNAQEFQPLAAQLPLIPKASDCIVVPVLALQVTIFPKTGISVGFTNHHVVGDARSIFNFMKAWALITKFSGDAPFLDSGSLPFYDRTVIKDSNGLDTLFLSQIRKSIFDWSETPQHPTTITDKVRATFVMNKTNIQRLKNLVSAKRPALAHVSTFTVICAYVWACIVKTRAASGEELDEGELEHFVCTGDCRARLNPPIPATYFGNCIAPACFAKLKSTELIGQEGFLFAAEVIGEGIRERMQNEEGVLKGAETWLSGMGAVNKDRILGVAGSPKFNYYDTDFGWGNPKKFEFISIDMTGAMSLTSHRDSDGGVEVGLSFPKAKMDYFAAIFAEGLANL